MNLYVEVAQIREILVKYYVNTRKYVKLRTKRLQFFLSLRKKHGDGLF